MNSSGSDANQSSNHFSNVQGFVDELGNLEVTPLGRAGVLSVEGTLPDPVTVLICDSQAAYGSGLSTLIEQSASDLTVVGMSTSLAGAEKLASRSLPAVLLVAESTCTAEALEQLRRASPGSRVVILSPDCDGDGLWTALSAGAVGYVSKDSDVREIVDAVRLAACGYLVLPQALTDPVVAGLRCPWSAPPQLDADELELLACVAEGATNRQISRRLHLSERTVCRRLQGLYAKLGVHGRLEAALRAADQLSAMGAR